MDITDVHLEHDIGGVAQLFQIRGGFVGAVPYGSGHINDTYRATFDEDGVRVQYIFQRINRGIFKDTPALMENIWRVTTHLAEKRAGEADRKRRVLTLIPALDGKPYACDEQGDVWRVYIFIERARTFDAVEFPQQAFQAAKAFGEFQRLLTELPPPRLHDTIPDFHHTPKRYAALEKAIEADVANRAGLAQREIEFSRRHKDICAVLLDAGLPERVTHNDTKFNNVMLDDATGEGICVIDLDTVMAGLAPYDFGDMVRTTTSATPEDERDLSNVAMQFEMFEALARGYLSSAGEFLTKAEKELLPFSGKLITFEIGIRFLTDFLAGDTYFKVHREGHNLDRCRTQFKLLESLEQQEEHMDRLIARI